MSAGDTTTGAAGGVRSTLKVTVLDRPLALPAASVASARTPCEPSTSGLPAGWVTLQLPEPSAITVPTRMPST